MFGFRTVFVEEDGTPAERMTEWIASCFVLLGYIIWVGRPRQVEE